MACKSEVRLALIAVNNRTVGTCVQVNLLFEFGMTVDLRLIRLVAGPGNVIFISAPWVISVGVSTMQGRRETGG